MEADLEGPVPESMQSLTRAHGGPLTDPSPQRPSFPPFQATRLHARENSSKTARWRWCGPTSRTPGSVRLSRRRCQLRGRGTPRYCSLAPQRSTRVVLGADVSQLKEIPASGSRSGVLPSGVSARQFTADSGASVVSVVNRSETAWTGDLRALYPVANRLIGIPAITVPPHNALWLPVNVPLPTGLAATDHLVYATAELTAIEYENRHPRHGVRRALFR